MATVTQVREAEARHADQAVHVRLEHRPLVRFAALVEQIAAEREPGGVDEDVDPTELCDRFLDEALAALRIGDVELEPVIGLGIRSTRRAPPTTRAPSRASVSGRRGTDTARRAGDDGRLSLQAGHRWTLTAERAVTRHGFTQFDLGSRRLGMFDLKRRVSEAEPIAEDQLEPPARGVTVGSRRHEHMGG